MMEVKKKYPSLPANYVTLQQLQERRLKEQQEQRQKEKEEEELRTKLLEEQEEMERQRQQKEEEERKLHQTQTAQAIQPKTSARSNRWKPPNFSEGKRWIGKEIGSEMQKGEGVAIGIAADGRISDEIQKPEESNQKKKRNRLNRSKKKTMSRKTEVESDAGVLEQSQGENGRGGNQIPVETNEENKGKNKKMEQKMKEEEASIKIVEEANEEIKRRKNKKLVPKTKEEETSSGIVEEKERKKGDEGRNTFDCDKKPVRRVQRIHGGIRQWSKGTVDEKAARASGVKEKSVTVTVTVVEKIARELGDLAVADGHEQEEKEEKHGGSLTLRGGSGNHWGDYNFRRGQWVEHGKRNTRNGSQMWVKKGESSNGNGIGEGEGEGKGKGKGKGKTVCAS